MLLYEYSALTGLYSHTPLNPECPSEGWRLKIWSLSFEQYSFVLVSAFPGEDQHFLSVLWLAQLLFSSVQEVPGPGSCVRENWHKSPDGSVSAGW